MPMRPVMIDSSSFHSCPIASIMVEQRTTFNTSNGDVAAHKPSCASSLMPLETKSGHYYSCTVSLMLAFGH
eukprot:11224845-Lingulodinium_polyedra.AAC.1